MNTVRTRERERGLDPLRSITSLLAAGWKYMQLPAFELKTRSPPVFQGSTRGGGAVGGTKCQGDRPQIGFCRGTITSMSTHDSPPPPTCSPKTHTKQRLILSHSPEMIHVWAATVRARASTASVYCTPGVVFTSIPQKPLVFINITQLQEADLLGLKEEPMCLCHN